MKSIAIVIGMTLSVGCATNQSKSVKDGRIRNSWGRVSNSDSIRTRGIGASDLSLRTKTQRKATSRNAALASARYEMLILIKGANMGGGITVGLAIQKDTALGERVTRLIRGAEEIKTEWLEDDGCVVTIEIKRNKLKKILKEDRKWEAIHSRRNIRERSRIPAYNNRVRQVVYGQTKSPTKAGFYGLIFPGGGLMYAGHSEIGGTAMALTTVLAVKGVEQPGFFAGAGVLHLLTAWWGVQAVNESNARITFTPMQSGGNLAYSRRF